jgi:hypothetical protein
LGHWLELPSYANAGMIAAEMRGRAELFHTAGRI